MMDVQMEAVCRDRFGALSLPVFQVWSCTLCYHYLFPDLSPRPHPSPPHPSAMSGWGGQSGSAHLSNLSIVSPRGGEAVSPNMSSPEALSRVCAWLHPQQCRSWLTCCHSAALCCQRQVLGPAGPTPQLNRGSALQRK